MERHRCKLCCKSFMNGRALGGHMRSHLATLPLPPKKSCQLVGEKLQLTESGSSSTRSDGDEDKEKLGFYVLRENPKRSVKLGLDPELWSDVVQDRESETESTQNNPTRRRSKRSSQRRRVDGFGFSVTESKKCKLNVGTESATESTPVSSVSDPSQDEEVALCLMMLSRDVWVVREEKSVEDTNDSAELKPARAATRAAKFKCMGCKKVFRTSRALAGHRASNRQCCGGQQQQQENFDEDQKIFECPFCYKVFGSGQALGGHKRSHVLTSSTNNNNNNNNINVNVVGSDNTDNIVVVGSVSVVTDKLGDTSSFVLDLNLPAPVEEEDDDGWT